MYMLKNKTAFQINFELMGNKLLFINCHLNSGQRHRVARQEQWEYIFTNFAMKGYNSFQDVKPENLTHE